MIADPKVIGERVKFSRLKGPKVSDILHIQKDISANAVLKMPFPGSDNAKLKLNDSDVPEIRVKTAFNGQVKRLLNGIRTL